MNTGANEVAVELKVPEYSISPSDVNNYNAVTESIHEYSGAIASYYLELFTQDGMITNNLLSEKAEAVLLSKVISELSDLRDRFSEEGRNKECESASSYIMQLQARRDKLESGEA